MGTFKFRCVFCRQKIEAQDEWDGMFAECPSCGRQIEVRRDDELTVSPPHTRLAPISPVSDTPVPPPLKSTFRKPFPPQMPNTAPQQPKTPAVPRKTSEPPTAAEKQAVAKNPPKPAAIPGDPVPKESPLEPHAQEAPKPFPKPFTIDLPKWELPGKDGTKK